MFINDWLKRLTGHSSALRESAGATVDEDAGWRKLSGDPTRDLQSYTLERAQNVSAYLWESNLLANRLIEVPLAYLLADGVRLTVSEPELQAVLDEFWDSNDLDNLLTDFARELALMGELCLPVFVNDYSGAVRLGMLPSVFIDTVRLDPGNPLVPIGVKSKRLPDGRVLEYRIVQNRPDHELFTPEVAELRGQWPERCFYFRVNGRAGGERGRPDLYASADWIDGYEQFMFGELDRASFMRAFIFDVTLTGATAEEIKARAKTIATPAPGSVRVHNEAEEWKTLSADLGQYESASGARLFRNHVLGGQSIPEHWFGGGGDVNRAAALEMGDPAFKSFSQRQRQLRGFLRKIGIFVLRQHRAAQGMAVAPDDPLFSVDAVFPELSVRDSSKYAAAIQQVIVAVNLAVDSGKLSLETGLALIAQVSQQMGVEIDPAAELEAVKAAKLEQAAADAYQGLPEDSALPEPVEGNAAASTISADAMP